MTYNLVVELGQVTQEWLESILKRYGYSGAITAFNKTVDSAFGTVNARIEVNYSQPTDWPTRFFLKIDGPDSLAGGREVEFYTQWGPLITSAPIPRCFDAVYDATQRAYHLLIEDLSESHYMIAREAPPTLVEAERMIDTLAVLHAGAWDRVNESIEFVDHGLLTEPPDYFGSFVDFMGERLAPARRGIYERILQTLPALLHKRLDHAVTIVHDDAHAWNFLHPRTYQSHQTTLIDWQQWGKSAGIHDVAYHISLFWYPDLRSRHERAIVQRYHTQLINHGVIDYGWDDCWYDYRLYILRNMLVPIWAFRNKHWVPHRWMQMEKSWFAFEDLNCHEIIS